MSQPPRDSASMGGREWPDEQRKHAQEVAKQWEHLAAGNSGLVTRILNYHATFPCPANVRETLARDLNRLAGMLQE